jgi:hypothetical protein
MQTEEGKEIERLIAAGDYAAGHRYAQGVLASADKSDAAKTEARRLDRGFRADPMAIVFVAITAIGLLILFLSYAGAR